MRSDGAGTPVVADVAALPPDASAPTLNIANGLTLLRLLLVPVFVALLMHQNGDADGWRVVAWFAFAVASLTDRIDGQLARARGLITPFGQIADPIADKALIGAALVTLSVLDELPWWVTVVVLAREIGVTLLRFWVIRHGVIPASRGGKLKTMLQAFAIGCYVLPFTGVLATARAALMAVAVTVTIATGADYVARALRLRRTSPRAELKRQQRAERRAL